MTDFLSNLSDSRGAEDCHSHTLAPIEAENIGDCACSGSVAVEAEPAPTPNAEVVAPETIGALPPFGELPPAESELFDRARAAVAALRGRGRQPNGQAGLNNTLRLTSGLRSKQLIEQPDIVAWHREQIQVITADLGGASELAALKRASIREAARLEVIAAALGDDLLNRGVLTGKGAMRAATTTYLQVLDRFVRITATLGLERKPKHVTLAELLVGQPDDERTAETGSVSEP